MLEGLGSTVIFSSPERKEFNIMSNFEPLWVIVVGRMGELFLVLQVTNPIIRQEITDSHIFIKNVLAINNNFILFIYLFIFILINNFLIFLAKPKCITCSLFN